MPMSFEERVSSENGGVEVLGGTDIVCGKGEVSGRWVSVSDFCPEISGLGLQFGNPSPMYDIQSICQQMEGSDLLRDGVLSESFLVSISELRYIVLVCIRWRLQNSAELVSSSGIVPEVSRGGSGLVIDTSSCDDSSAPSIELLLSHLFLYRSCVNESHREELEVQVVRDVLRLIDPSAGGVECLADRPGAAYRGFGKGGGAELPETSEMRDAESTLASQFQLARIPFPKFGVFLGKDATECAIGDIVSSTEHPSGLNLANVASTPSILGVLLKYFDVSWPSNIFESLLQNEGAVEEPPQQDSGSGPRDPGEVSLSLGSLTHILGLCKPCVFVNKTNKKCRNGVLCCFCHFQHKERKRGKRYKSAANACNSSGPGVGSGGVSGFSRSEVPAGHEDALRAQTAPSLVAGSARGSSHIFASGHPEQALGGVGPVQPALAVGTATGGPLDLSDLLASHCTLEQQPGHPPRICQGPSGPVQSLLPPSRSGPVFGRPPKPCSVPVDQQTRYFVPSPPLHPSKTSNLQVLQNEKDTGFLASPSLDSVATSASAGFHQLPTAYLEKSYSERLSGEGGGLEGPISVGSHGLTLEPFPFPGSQGGLPYFHDPLGDFTGCNKLINDASDMNNWISSLHSQSLPGAISASPKGFGCLQWLDRPEFGELITDTWGVAPFEALMNGGVYNIPPNLSDSLSKIDHPDWTLASAPKNPAANSPNSASESFNICHTNTSPSPSPPEQIPSQTSPPELNEQPPHGPASRPKTGFHAQSFPGHNEGLPIGPGNEFLLGSPNMLVPGFVAPPTLPPTSDGLSSPFTAPSGGVVPPFLRDNQGAEVPDYSVDCSPFSFLIGDLGEIGGAGIGATGFGMEFCFLNPWK